MWKAVNGRLIHQTDETRIRYKTRISSELIEKLKALAEQNNSHIGYLLENGYVNILKENSIKYDKKTRPKDRIEFRTTCDNELLEQLKHFAKKQKLNLNDVIEASYEYINLNEVKNADWRYRIEFE